MKKRRYKIGISILATVLVGSLAFGATPLKAEKITNSVQEETYKVLPTKITSYEELVKVLKEKGIIAPKDKENLRLFGATEDIVAQTESAAAGMQDMGSVEYSETNLQVSGVDEADILKTDGRYIYIKMENNKIAIVDTEANLQTVGMITSVTKDRTINFSKIFVDNNYLVAIGNRYEAPDELAKSSADSIRSYRTNRYFSTVQVYDITDKTSPKLLREVEVEGNMSEVRKIEETIYLVTNKYNYGVYEEDFTKEDILPFYRDSVVGAETVPVEVKGIQYNHWANCQAYTLITTFKINDKVPAKIKTILGNEDNLYMNEEALYLVNAVYGGQDTKSYITKYTVESDNVQFAESTYVLGSVLNQFSMDEYNDNFRIATTSNTGSAVYILDNKLQMVGKVEELAVGESIYSVRFDKTKAYVVTFEQVDPLFVIDLAIPSAPKVLGELKIPGFSQYLHPMGDDLVVGIGRSTSQIIRRDEKGNETVTGVAAEGIKLSLFDVSNPNMPKEINHITLGVSGSYSEALSDHKAVMANKAKKLLAIPISIQYKGSEEPFTGAYVFGIENGKLVGKAKLGQVWENAEGMYEKYMYGRYTRVNRVCYVGDKIYYAYGTQINEYDSETFVRLRTLQLDSQNK